MPVALRLVDVGVAQRLYAVAQHRAALGVQHRQRQAALLVLGGGDAVAAVLGEEVRPVFQPALVERMRVAGVKALDGRLDFRIHQMLMWLRQAFHKPRTAVSVMRESPAPTLEPPISITEARSGEPATPRCTKPVAAPSSIEM